ncbi:arylsulfatase [Vibrio sinaloensis]|uniref:sulfatase family protein n=1 Tax=Photobacterium sp. (strain ATCC 43367) TaxID=379097 RepID=UPI00057D5EAA|nr:arylsulfatase [Vibrio sinaloensis]KIE20092.1 arylsulfatase [Vibrio sinaloensis]
MTSDTQPNIILIYADDLGFGDLSCYGANDIPTPNLDRLASEGVKFHQGYATAATCTPSRYSLLTGSYPWRNPDAAVLPGDAPQIIGIHDATLPRMLQKVGYRTGIVGKWHLGLGNGELDFNDEIQGTPNDVGFDDSYIMAATNDRVPCVYINNRHVDNLDPNDPIEVTYDWDKAFEGVPTGRNNPELLNVMYDHGHDGTIINGVSRIGHMRGGQSAIWNDETMGETFANKAIEFIEQNQDQPFFLYYALHQPHVPRIPNPRFRGVTPHGVRGDVIVEMDWCIGQVLDKLEALGLEDNTLIIFSSDNGPVLNDGYKDDAVKLNGDHKMTGPLRGGKYSLFEGGTRVPFIVRWPLEISPGESNALFNQVDLYHSFAQIVKHPLTELEAPDSQPLLDTLLGKNLIGRESMVLEGMQFKKVYRDQRYAYIPAHDDDFVCQYTGNEKGNLSAPQLYDLNDDIGQLTNLAEQMPHKVEEMDSKLQELISSNATR